MVRSFLTRLIDSAARAVLLIPCLLICLACATPFPIESLEEGMTTEQVTEAFGEPSSTSTNADTWVYPHVTWFLNNEEVELYFDGNELVSWETRPAPSVPTTGTYVSFPSTMTFPTKKDTQHHKQGHKHHHGHGC